MSNVYIPNKEFKDSLRKMIKEMSSGSGPIHKELVAIFKVKEKVESEL